MSRAFVRESDHDGDEQLPDKAVSPHPNLVTPEGLRLIEEQIRLLAAARRQARAADDPAGLARTARELRYFTQRRASARVVEPSPSPSPSPSPAPVAVRFGVRVTLRFADGTLQAFRIVGEDQADPAAGLLSWVSPLATAAIGAEIGDVLEILGREAQVLAVEG